MDSPSDLYSVLKGDVSAVADPLFELSEKFLRDAGNFLPHAAVLKAGGKVALVGAYSGKESTSSTEVLPLLHDGLRAMAREEQLEGLGVAENVTVTIGNQQPSKAIKVLFEHRRGLTVALYLPFEKRLFKGYQFGSIVSLLANAEVNAWPTPAA